MFHWWCVTPHWLKSFTCLSSHIHAMYMCVPLWPLRFPYTSYFNLSFTVFFHIDLHTNFNNLESVENNRRHSAKGALTLATSPFPSQVTSFSTWFSTSSSIPNSSFPYVIPSSDFVGHERRYVRQAAQRRTPRIRRLPQSGRCDCQTVGRHYLSRPIERDNPWEKAIPAHRLGPCSMKIIVQCCEKVSHHELQAARVEQERKILQEVLWRQQQDFREVLQQNLTEMEELRKFPSQPMSFPTHSILEGMLRHSLVSLRRIEGPPSIWDTHGTSRNVFLQIHKHLHQLLILKNWSNRVRQLRSRFTYLQRRNVKGKNKIEIWDACLDGHPQIHSSSVEEIFQRIMEQTNNYCRFRSFILSSSQRL